MLYSETHTQILYYYSIQSKTMSIVGCPTDSQAVHEGSKPITKCIYI